MSTRDPVLPRLPVEVFPQIFTFLPGHHSSLAALALTCSYFHRLAEPVLYTTFSSYILPICLGFSKAIIERPRHAQMVQSYRIHEFFVNSWGMRRENLIDQRNEWVILIGQALRCMVNLRHLEFRPDQPRWRGHTSFLPNQCTFQLETLIWPTDVDDSALKTFLEGQICLKQMSVYLSGWYGPLPLASCPELVVLKGNSRVVSKLLPGRHVKHLEILSTGSDEGATEQLGLCTKELNQLLSFIIECRVSKLPAPLEQFRSLRYLRLLAIYDDEVHLVVNLPKLHTLVLNSAKFETQSWEQRTPEQQQDLVLRLSVSLPKLVRVDIGDALSSHVEDYRGYRRWMNCELQPNWVLHHEIELAHMMDTLSQEKIGYTENW